MLGIKELFEDYYGKQGFHILTNYGENLQNNKRLFNQTGTITRWTWQDVIKRDNIPVIQKALKDGRGFPDLIVNKEQFNSILFEYTVNYFDKTSITIILHFINY